MFEVQSQQPGNFSLHGQNCVRGVQLVLQTSHLRLQRAHLRIQRVAFGRFRAALLRGQLPQRTLAPRFALSRQMRAVQPLAAKQAAHLAGLCAALRLLQNPQPISSARHCPKTLRSSTSALGAMSQTSNRSQGEWIVFFLVKLSLRLPLPGTNQAADRSAAPRYAFHEIPPDGRHDHL